MARTGSAAELGQQLGPVGQELLHHGTQHRLVDVPVDLVPVDAPERRVGVVLDRQLDRVVGSSVRRATNARAITRVDVGLILRDVGPAGRLETAARFNALFTHRVRLSRPAEVDTELRDWLHLAYGRAG